MGEERTEQKEIALGTLYDLNKTLVEKGELELTEGILNSKKEIVKNFIVNTNNSYYMLLCNEQKDFTIFNITSCNCDREEGDNSNCHKCQKEKIKECVNILVDECLKNRGAIKGIDITKDKGAIEIWLSIDGEAYVYYFFPYDAALIQV